MRERLPKLTESDLDEVQLGLYRGITQGPRATGRQLFELTDEDGALNGPFGVMLHAPELGLALQEVGAAVRYRTTLPDRAREIAILKVAVVTRSDFEWYAHARVGRAAGLTEGELTALSQDRFTSEDAVERAVAELCDTLLADQAPTDEVYDALVAVLGRQQLVEVVVLVGYYRTLAQMMAVFSIGAPEED